MIKIAIDTSPLSKASKFRGIGRYSVGLIEALKKTKKLDVLELSDKNFKPEVDIVHYPFFDFYFLTLPLIKKVKTVVTIHDCIPLVFPENYPAGLRGKIKFFIQKISLKSVSAVLTDSESSEKDIVKFLSIPSEKIFKVYLAVDDYYRKIEINQEEKESLFKKFGLKNDFMLYVGDVNYNKNLPNLLKAFAQARIDLNLVLIGKAFESSNQPEVMQLTDLVAELKIQDRVKILGFVSDRDLVIFYNLAVVYCQPSLYEGFGLQILEAMACGCPVLTGNVSSLPEVAGEAAVLVDPNDIDQISRGIERLVLDQDLRNRLIEMGLTQNKKFSWDKTAQETVKIYEKVLGK